MSFVLVGAEILDVENTPLITAYPFTVGVWVNPLVDGVFKGVWSLGSAGAGQDRIVCYAWDTQWNFYCDQGGTSQNDLAGTVTPGAWQFIVCRGISATNRWIAVINTNGSASHAQATTSLTPATINTFTIGDAAGGDRFSGRIAEFWLTRTDIQADGAQLNDATLRQLAYGGPFSVPHIGKDILEYRSFRKHPFRDEAGEVYYGGGNGVHSWNVTGTPTIGAHPPLPYWYAKNTQTESILMI